jgi:PTH1 family peptidyl-tRNA hydrolase
VTASEAPIRRAFRGQGKSCAMLGSAFMGRLMPLLADRLQPSGAVARRVLDWPGDVGPGGQSVPLRLAGALHGLVLDGADDALAHAYPPNRVDDDTLIAAVEGAMSRHEARMMAWLDHAPQTNEVRRAAALIPAIWWALARHDLPVVLSELGASAGLNLSLDRFALAMGGAVHGPENSPVRLEPDWTGAVPCPAPIRVEGRAGVDLNPLDPTDPAHALRLCAFLWPDQPARMALTRGAIGLSATVPEQGDAGDWLARRLADARPGCLHVVYHSIAWQYFPAATQAKARAALAAAGARAGHDAPLAHIAMEADGDPEGAVLTAQVWPARAGEDGPQRLARVDYHGRWVKWLR